MLVYNPCVNDSRVIREAEALAEAGYDVTVLAKRAPGVPIREMRNGVVYRRVVSATDTWYPKARRRAHLIASLRADPYRVGRLRKLAGRSVAAWSRGLYRAPSTTDAAAPARSWKHILRSVGLIVLSPFIAVFALISMALRGAWRLLRAAGRILVPSRWSGAVFGPPVRLLWRLVDTVTRAIRPSRWGGVTVLAPTVRSLRRLRGAFIRSLKWVWKTARRSGTRLRQRMRRFFGAIVRRLNWAWKTARRSSAHLKQRTGRGWRAGLRRLSRPRVMAATRIRAAHKKHVHTPLVLWFKRWSQAGFIFESVDVAMRRQLLRLRPDIIHAHDLMTLPTASHAASDLGAMLVYDSHELELHRNAEYPKLAWKRRGWLEKRHIRRADLVVTVSDSIADHLRDVYSIARPAVVMNAPPLPDRRHGGGKTVRRSLGLDAKTPLAIYVGSVTINRGIEMCVRALKHDPSMHFATIGPRRKPNEIELLALAESEGVSERFHLIDPVAPDKVVTFVKDADVSVLPIQNVCLSYYYCMPNKLFESVIGGLPVAVADLVELRRFVERYPCGVVMDETDPADIARAIRKVFDNRDSYILRGPLLAEVRATYCWPAQTRRLVDAYAAMNGGRPAPPVAGA